MPFYEANLWPLNLQFLFQFEERDNYVELWQNATNELESLQEVERVWSVNFGIVTALFSVCKAKLGITWKLKLCVS